MSMCGCPVAVDAPNRRARRLGRKLTGRPVLVLTVRHREGCPWINTDESSRVTEVRRWPSRH